MGGVGVGGRGAGEGANGGQGCGCAAGGSTLTPLAYTPLVCTMVRQRVPMHHQLIAHTPLSLHVVTTYNAHMFPHPALT